MYIPEMYQEMKSRIPNARLATPILLSDRVTGSQQIPLLPGSVINVEVQSKESGIEILLHLPGGGMNEENQ